MEYNTEPSIYKDDLKRSDELNHYRYNPYSKNETDKIGEFNKHNNEISKSTVFNDLKSEYERNKVLSTGASHYSAITISQSLNLVNQVKESSRHYFGDKNNFKVPTRDVQKYNKCTTTTTTTTTITTTTTKPVIELISTFDYRYNHLSRNLSDTCTGECNINQSDNEPLKLRNQVGKSSKPAEYTNSSAEFGKYLQFSNFSQPVDKLKTSTTTTKTKSILELTSTFDYNYNPMSSNLSDITGKCNIDENKTLPNLNDLKSEHERNNVLSTGEIVFNYYDPSPRTPLNQSIRQLSNSRSQAFPTTSDCTNEDNINLNCISTDDVQIYKKCTHTIAMSKTALDLSTSETYNASEENFSYLNETDEKYAVHKIFERSDKFYKAIANSQLLESMESIKNKRINMIVYFTRNAEIIFERAPERYDNNVIFLATYIADYYLITNAIDMELSVVREAAWRLASKYESRAIQCSYSQHNREVVQNMERNILKAFHFDVNIPHPLGILNAIVKCADVPQEVYMMTQCILEIILRNFKHIKYETKRLAIATLYYSLKHLVPQRATMLLIACTDYHPCELIYDIEFIHENIRTAVSFASDVIIKYRRPEYLEISKELYVKL